MTKKLMLMIATLAVAFGAWAATETVGGYTWTYRINGDTAEIYKGDRSPAISPSPTGAVTIPSTLGGKPVTSIWNSAFSGCSGLASVTIPNSVMSIGNRVFYGCSGLASVTIPNSVMSIGNYVFYGCSGLASVTIPNSVTSIGDYAFEGCSGLASVAIPDGVTSIGNYVFSGCSGLTGVTIPDSVTRIGNSAFSGCSGLASVTIPNSVTSIGNYVFSGCGNVKEVTVPGWRCGLPFDNVTNLVISTGTTSISNNAFSGWSALASVTIPDSVMNIGLSAFSGCIGLMSFSVSSGNLRYKSVNGLLLSKDGKTLVAGVNGDVTIPDEVASIKEWAFSGCSGLTSVTIPDSVTRIGEYAFSGCSGLKSVTIPDSVVSIGRLAFSRCRELNDVLMPRISDSKSAFSGCSPNLTIRYWNYRLILELNSVKYGMLTGGGSYIAEDKATLTAVANAGYAFAGWFTDRACKKALNPKGYDNLKPTVKYTMPAKNTTVYAKFVTKAAAKKSLKFSSATKKLAKTATKATAGKSFSLALGISSATLPTVTAKGLPKGLSIDKTTGEITGVGTVPGAYTATVTVKDAAGNKITQKVKINVSMPSWAKGSFYGVANPICQYFCDPKGYLKFTIGSDGNISGKVAFWDDQKLENTSYSFTSTCKSCTTTKATFSLKRKIGSFTFKSGKVTVSKKRIGGVVVTEAVSDGGSHAVSAQKKPGLVKKGKAFASLVGKKFTFTKSNTPYDVAYILNQSGGKLKVSLANGDVIRLSYVAGGRTILSQSWALTLSDMAYSSNEYVLSADFFDRRLSADGFTFNLKVGVNDSGKVTGVSAEINSNW